MKYSNSDKLQIAKIIAGSLGIEDTEETSPIKLINAALTKSKKYNLHNNAIKIIDTMLSTAKEAGIKFNDKLVPKLTSESIENNKKGDIEDLSDEEIEDPSDEEIEKMISDIDSFDDIMDLYDNDEMHIIDDDGNHMCHLKDLEGMNESIEYITEILTRQDRIKAAVRFARSAGKRERRMKIALHTRSTPAVMNRRARVAAINIMKVKIAHKPLNTLSLAEKERIERIVARKKSSIGKIALKLIPKLRKIENSRLHPIINK